MKKRKNKKIIFNVFLSFILIFLFFCGDLQVFAYNATVTFSLSTSYNYYSYSYGYVDTSYTRHAIGSGTKLPTSLTFDSSLYSDFVCFYVFQSVRLYDINSGYYTRSCPIKYNGTNLSTSGNSPTVINTFTPIFTISSTYSNNNTFCYFTFEEPTPEPTPTPTPAPTPTPLPVDYDDTQFWGRVNYMAEGGWTALTAAFNGIFNNTVLRNLVVYVPLFGAIIYLFVYLLFMGSD